MLVDQGGKILEANESASAHFASAPQDLADLRLPDLFSEEGLVQVADAMDSLMSGAARVRAMRLCAIDAKGQDARLDVALGLLEKNACRKAFLMVFEKSASPPGRPMPSSPLGQAAHPSIKRAMADASSGIRCDLAALSERMKMVQRRIEEIGLPDLASSLSGSINLLDSASIMAERIPDPNGHPAIAMQAIDMNRVLFTAMMACGKRLDDPRFDIKTDLERNLFIIDGDPQKLERAISNILINAIEAMPDGGELMVSSRNMVDASPLSIKISITDTGTGMDTETRALMFDPSFTTKGIHGTGLGLAVSSSIIAAHGGMINVESNPGLGTRFDIILKTY